MLCDMPTLSAPLRSLVRDRAETKKFRLLLAGFPAIMIVVLVLRVHLNVFQSQQDLILASIFAIFPLALGTVSDRAAKATDVSVVAGEKMLSAAVKSLVKQLVVDMHAIHIYMIAIPLFVEVASQTGTVVLALELATATAVYLIGTFKNNL